MTKEEKIKEAWGGSYGGEMDENGWKPLQNAFIPGTLSVDVSPSGKFYRPVCLRNIERNNGWIKIESEDDLPKENIDCFCILESGKILITNSRKKYFWCSDNKWLYNYYEFTHYQPIEKPKPPLY